MALLVGGATYWLAAQWRVLPLVYAAQWLALGLVAMPLLFVSALASVCAVLTVLLVVLAAPWFALRRPTGLAETLVEVWALPRSILPRYWQALRLVRQPALWGALAGFVVAVGTFVMRHGLRAPA